MASTVSPPPAPRRRRWGIAVGTAAALAGLAGLAGLAAVAAACSPSTRPRAVSAHRVGPDGAVASLSVPGFDQVAFRVTTSAGAPAPTASVGRKRCALYAYTVAQQEQGLMHRLDLADYDGMVFRFARPSTVEFYMKDTLIPLSIAWFDRGRFVSAADMAPCTTTVCPLFPAAGPYTVAIEVLQGHLAQLGIGAGSTISVGGSC